MRKAIFSSLIFLSVVGCTTVNGVTTLDPTFLANVQALAAKTCAIIPAIESVVAVVNSGVSASAKAVTDVICAVVTPLSSARFRAIPLKSQSPAAPAVIGVTDSGITITGWRASSFGGKRHR